MTQLQDIQFQLSSRGCTIHAAFINDERFFFFFFRIYLLVLNTSLTYFYFTLIYGYSLAYFTFILLLYLFHFYKPNPTPFHIFLLHSLYLGSKVFHTFLLAHDPLAHAHKDLLYYWHHSCTIITFILPSKVFPITQFINPFSLTH